MRFTDEELKEMSLEKAVTEITNQIYEVTALFEFLEHKGKVMGNGHHMRQKVSEFAEDLMRSRWANKSLNPTTKDVAG